MTPKKPCSKYLLALREEMTKLGEIPNSIFCGQQVKDTTFYDTLNDVPEEKRIELGVIEELQMGISIGLAIKKYLPISIYQRCDFLPRAADQLINHLNLFPELTNNLLTCKVIIRTTVGTTEAGPQHSQDLTEMFKLILKFPVLKVKTPEEVHAAYELARTTNTSIMIVELQELY